jgi:aminoglycoside phosphotransferase (APT) family kinase protein
VEPPWLDELAERLGARVERAVQVAGGASKEAWAVDLVGEGDELLVRRARPSVIHELTLPLRDEHALLEAMHAAGVRVPRPVAYLGELGGQEAFAMVRVRGETIGRRVVQLPELEAARRGLPLELAEELARIHAVARESVAFLERPEARAPLERFAAELDALDEPHPAIELGLHWLRERLPLGGEAVVLHGDFRVGNLVVSRRGLEYVLDWEFAHFGDPGEDLGFPLVRAWRFGADGLRLGGIGEVEPYLERYNERSGREVPLADLYAFEVLGNVRWAVGALNQARRHLKGPERSVELAVLGRLAAEVEYELLDLLERAP